MRDQKEACIPRMPELLATGRNSGSIATKRWRSDLDFTARLGFTILEVRGAAAAHRMGKPPLQDNHTDPHRARGRSFWSSSIPSRNRDSFRLDVT